jgi:hypothetical protein
MNPTDNGLEITSKSNSRPIIFNTGGTAEKIVEIKTTGLETPKDITVNGKKVTTEAPEDGKQYARQDGNWSEVEATSSGGDSIWTEESGKAVYDGDVIVGSKTNGTGKLQVSDGANYTFDVKSGSSGNVIIGGTSGTGLQLQSGGIVAMSIHKDGILNFPFATFPSGSNAGYTLKMNSGGNVYRDTTANYSAEEVDKKLAIKDKLIEKLSARLDKLEKKLK